MSCFRSLSFENRLSMPTFQHATPGFAKPIVPGRRAKRRIPCRIWSVVLSLWAWMSACLAVGGVAGECHVNGHQFTVPDGFEVALVAGPKMADRPINGSLDDQGRLYVTVSSGSNDNVQTQLETRPHRIVRLEDTDGDGVYDRSTPFADRLMFPEGALWHAGSLYVAAPPQIWKFTDVDDDGRSDRREVWFDGQTLTGCANDLHGPYLGLDGWIYWCKGAYAEQTYERPGRPPLVTRAAHIFRRHPEGGFVDVVMTGGMANPVDVVFTPAGERIFTTTFLVRPQHGLRDGLIHAIYGGAYGERRPQVLEHPRTGPLMPPLVHLGAAAPSGLARLRSKRLGDGYQHNLMASLFNMRKITRHVLTHRGATFEAVTSDFLVSDQLDFHPTDVLEDADGSLIVIDTGGWYKLCCPTSQLWKPDVLGGIYRVQRSGRQRVVDAVGAQVDWPRLSNSQLLELMADARHVVARRAADDLVRREATDTLRVAVAADQPPQVRLGAVWALGRMDTVSSRSLVRHLLSDEDPLICQAALNLVSLHRDRLAIPQLLKMLTMCTEEELMHVRRLAAEALGRCGADATATLLAAVGSATDRALEHALIYATFEINDRHGLRQGLASDAPHVRRASLIALDQIEASDLESREVVPLLRDTDSSVQDAAWWVAEQHPGWGDECAPALGELLSEIAHAPDSQRETMQATLVRRLVPFVACVAVQDLLDGILRETVPPDELRPGDDQTHRLATSARQATQRVVLAALSAAEFDTLPSVWHESLLQLLASPSRDRLQGVLKVLDACRSRELPPRFETSLQGVADNPQMPVDLRLHALAKVPGSKRTYSDSTWSLILTHLTPDKSVVLRGHALHALENASLSEQQQAALVATLPQTGPMEFRRLVNVLAALGDERVGAHLVAALPNCPSVTTLSTDELRHSLASFGSGLSSQIDPVIRLMERERGQLLSTMQEALAHMDQADVRRGQAVFHSSRAACTSCHKLGYVGGQIGPGLTRIGKTRSERDLLEAILFPSNSFVQNYEPVVITTRDGRILQGLVQGETEDRIQLQLDAQRTVSVAKENIETQEPGRVSVMPSGLEKQFTLQELADLVAFLKSAD